jgi:hypothetical protein
MTIRNARNYTMAMARESVWNTPPVGRYAALRLSGETLHLVQQRRGQALLNDAGIVPPDRVVRSHVEGRISTPADTGAIQQWMTLITGNQWASELSKRVLTVAAAETPPSFTLVRTLDGTPQHRAFFSGVKVQRLQLAPAADQTFMLQASLVGASQDQPPPLCRWRWAQRWTGSSCDLMMPIHAHALVHVTDMTRAECCNRALPVSA